MANRPRKRRPHNEFLTVPFSGRIPTTADKEAWLETAYREFSRALRAKYRAVAVDDIATSEVLRAAERVDQIILTWSVKRYVRQRVNGDRALLDWKRSERVQRCEGARGTRTYVSLEAPLPATPNGRERTAADVLIDVTAPSVDEQVTTGLIHTILATLDERERTIIVRRHLEGWQITEIAAHLGLSRERTSRIYSDIVRRLRATFGDQVAAYFSDDIQPPC